MQQLLYAVLTMVAGVIGCAIYFIGSNFILDMIFPAKGSDTARSDIDLMVICDDLAYSDLYEALQEAEATLGRPVHVNLATAAEWKRKLAEGNAFITKIQAQPRVPLIGSVDDLA